jgi:hypothetical protein
MSTREFIEDLIICYGPTVMAMGVLWLLS